MKLLSTIMFLSIFFSTVYAETSCTLSWSGVHQRIIFQDYVTTISDDLSDPACRTPMGRPCSQLRVSKSELTFPRDVKVVHKIVESYDGLTQTRRHSQLIVYKDNEWFATFDGHYVSGTDDSQSTIYQYYAPPKFRVQFGRILEGGYTLECRESI